MRTPNLGGESLAPRADHYSRRDGGNDKSPDGIKRADSGSKSPSPSGSGPAEADRPDVRVPKDLKLVFDFDKPSDPRKRQPSPTSRKTPSTMRMGPSSPTRATTTTTSARTATSGAAWPPTRDPRSRTRRSN
ncbi:hypothetical protein KEF29_37395 [Streptomyces tuirus]|uniref:Uncharacterized protein n=1 Tax=Streptomyces tuirus TaxID=68278 RepID=A0A941J1C8_9ACTN|nr:hypothetical protein [Streptomyces tuirus]